MKVLEGQLCNVELHYSVDLHKTKQQNCFFLVWHLWSFPLEFGGVQLIALFQRFGCSDAVSSKRKFNICSHLFNCLLPWATPQLRFRIHHCYSEIMKWQVFTCPKSPNIFRFTILETSQTPQIYQAIMTSGESSLPSLFSHSFDYANSMVVTTSNDSRIIQDMSSWCFNKSIYITEKQAAFLYILTPSLDILQQ